MPLSGQNAKNTHVPLLLSLCFLSSSNLCFLPHLSSYRLGSHPYRPRLSTYDLHSLGCHFYVKHTPALSPCGRVSGPQLWLLACANFAFSCSLVCTA